MRVSSPNPPPLGVELERARLRHRERRLDVVLGLLRQRQVERRERGHVPAPLTESIRGFGVELACVRRRLDELS